MALLMADTYRLLLAPHAVTLFARTDAAGGFAAGVPVADVHRTATPRDERAGPPALLARATTRFHLWATKLGAAVPKPGDVIEEAGARWTVQAVGKEGQGARYRCECVQERA